jgi:putative oxidoreductase
MVGHGVQKLTRRFDGGGVERTAAGFEHLGLRPARRQVYVAAGSEIASGVSLLAGAWTPAGTAALTGTMTVAARRVHGPKGLWINKGGCEYNLVLMAIAYAIAAVGPGRPALDGTLTRSRHGHRWALAQLAGGVAAGTLVLATNPIAPAPAATPTSHGGPTR